MLEPLKPIHWAMSWLFDYRLTEEALEVVAAGGQLPLRRFPYGQIKGAWKGWSALTEHYHNRVDLWDSCVTVELDRPVLPHLSLTPAEPEAFLAELEAKLAGHRAAHPHQA